MKRTTLLCTIVIAMTGSSLSARGDDAPATERPLARFKGPLADPNFFPIAVWLQNPNQANRYREAGINLYVALWRGPTDQQLEQLKAADMKVICSQNRTGLAHKDDPTIIGWMHGDEPDNAQEVVDRATGRRHWGPPIKPSKIIADYKKLQATDPTRPILLNLGQGVANDQWHGRGPEGKIEDYPEYVKGCDLVSFDVYPVAGLDREDAADLLWYVAKGVDRLVKWTGGRKAVWNCIECTHISNPSAKATPHQVRAEVWMSLIHGSRGLIYFVHQFKPSFNEHALLDDPEMLRAVTAINRQIHDLAPVLNSPSVEGAATVHSSNSKVPIDVMVKRHGGTTYVFAVAMRNAPTRGTFQIKGLGKASEAKVLGEGGSAPRQIKVDGGRFEDDFEAFGVHLYAIRP